MIATPSAPEAASSLSLESLMSGYQQADEQAAATLIERVSPLLLRYFWVHAYHRGYAEDLLQETWMRIHKARPTYRRGSPVLPWIFAIARHTGLDYYRGARRVEVREMQVDPLPEVAAKPVDFAAGDAEPEMAELDAVLAHLPASQREVVVMLKVSGMTVEEVARATASSAGSVKQKAHRAYRKLREAFAQGARSK
jgi:RNA polymerase sigma-70 factor (ECF subfamily)